MLHKLFEWHILNWLVSDTKEKKMMCRFVSSVDSGWNLEKNKSQLGNKMLI